MRHGAAAALALCLAALAPQAARAASSRHDPAYAGGTLLGFAAPLGGLKMPTSFRLEAELGYHPSGRHDGFVIGFRQGFSFGGRSADYGFSALRMGGDIPIPIRGGRMELTIGPYGAGGLAYSFNSGGAQGYLGIGVEGRFFPFPNNGFYALAKPFEIQVLISSNSTVSYGFGVGCGYAF